MRRFWQAYAVSALGSGIGTGALPLVAVWMLDVSDWQVSQLAVLAGLAGVLIAVPLGPFIEFRHKRPTMIVADLARFGALISVPAAAGLGLLTYTQLCGVAVVQTVGAIVANAASNPYLKALVPAEHRATVASRLEATMWTADMLGPPVGGVLVAATGPVTTVAVDAVSFLLSAMGWTRLRHREPPPPAAGSGADRRWIAEAAAGWRYILAHRTLRALFGNALLFGGCIMASAPLLTLLLLRELQVSAIQYGLALGIPCAAALLGSLLAPTVIRRAGLERTLLIVGVARCLWMGLLPLAPTGSAGLIVIVAAESALLLCAGLFNPAFAVYRMNATDDRYLARVVTAWAISSKLVQPAVIAAAGLLAAVTSIRTALAGLAGLLLVSTLLLPWKPHTGDPTPSTPVTHP